MSSAVDRLYRRILMMVSPVKITATDDTGPVHRAQVRGFPPETIDNMPVLQIYGLASHAMAGSDAVAIFAGGDRSNGMIIATGNQQFRLRGLEPGEVALYDNNGSVVKLGQGGNISLTCTGSVTIVGTQGITVGSRGEMTIDCDTLSIHAPDGVAITTPKLRVNGEITASGPITGNSP